MQAFLIIYLVGFNGSYLGTLGYHFGSWDNWPGNGLRMELAYGLSGRRLNVNMEVDFSYLSFSKEGESFSFNDLCFRVNPNFCILPTFSLKIGPFFDYNILFGTFHEKWDATKYAIKTIYLAGYGVNAEFNCPVTQQFSIGLGFQYKTICGFKKFNVFCVGLLFEHKL
jgi:hypothetical protein